MVIIPLRYAQGMLFAYGDVLPFPSHVIRLYAHEATRVYRDKLVDFEDQKMFDQLLLEALRKNIPVRLTAYSGGRNREEGRCLFVSSRLLF